ncbi:MAG: nucleotidyltransferase substrate binding protein [Aquificaceae bacterium]|uniref:nucleotidyltransferase substrate binding protein n=1 Tax=Hydrogenobacter sp. Uz 6-8 TaxID=3384828 RepID=UPI00309F9151
MACGERLLKKLVQTEKALKKLEGVRALEERLEEELLYEVATKRFEYTFESLWKTIRLFLLEKKGLECNSPMDCLKGFYSVGLLSREVAEKIAKTVRLRNEVVHIYDFSLAGRAYVDINSTALPLFRAVVERIKEECQKED